MDCDPHAAFFGFMGITTALVFSSKRQKIVFSPLSFFCLLFAFTHKLRCHGQRSVGGGVFFQFNMLFITLQIWERRMVLLNRELEYRPSV